MTQCGHAAEHGRRGGDQGQAEDRGAEPPAAQRVREGHQRRRHDWNQAKDHPIARARCRCGAPSRGRWRQARSDRRRSPPRSSRSARAARSRGPRSTRIEICTSSAPTVRASGIPRLVAEPRDQDQRERERTSAPSIAEAEEEHASLDERPSGPTDPRRCRTSRSRNTPLVTSAHQRAPSGRVDLERDQQRAEVRDLGAREAEQVGRAPEGHVEPEEAVPQIVDGRGEDDDRHTPPRQMEAARAAEPGDRHACRPTPRRLAPATSRRRGRRTRSAHATTTASVGHDVRGDPERIAPDDEVPADVPADAPASDQLRGEQRPERAAPNDHRHDAMIHCAPQ